MEKKGKEAFYSRERSLWEEAKAEGLSLAAQLLNKQLSLEQFAEKWAEGRIEKVKDHLTGLFSRRFFEYELPIHLAAAERYNRPLVLMMADLDKFKETNDRFGHLAGDEVLREVGKIVREVIRESDVPAKYGGEEIIAILPDTDETGSAQLAERLRKTVEEAEVVFQGKTIPCTISVGLATFPQDAKSQEKLIENADRALYAAKNAGRNCVRIFSKIP